MNTIGQTGADHVTAPSPEPCGPAAGTVSA
jgi:hypothetical protein